MVEPMANHDDSRTPRGTRTIRRILDAAASSFGEQGFRGASMSAVAKAAGVSKGLLHYHFTIQLDSTPGIFFNDWSCSNCSISTS